VLVGIVIAVLAAVIGILVGTVGPALSSSAPLVSSTPGTADGVIPADAPASLDASLPAISRLDPALLSALRAANADARREGIEIRIASGWRSIPYQRWLFDQAVKTYGSVEAAGRYVASPETSAHVTGKAVDVAPVDAQLWLRAHGSAYGLCQTYANERWHFERATSPGGVCPALRRDASG
jgi:zinc D-Ala-D-Ala carboxypeptidase